MARRRNPSDTMEAALLERRGVVVCGAGGGGQTTPAAALAPPAAAKGGRVPVWPPHPPPRPAPRPRPRQPPPQPRAPPPRPRLPGSPGPADELPRHERPAVLPPAVLRGRPPDPQGRHPHRGHGLPADRPVPGPPVPAGPLRVLPGLRRDVRWVQGAGGARARPPARPLLGVRPRGGAVLPGP